jgi:hypothetical protein
MIKANNSRLASRDTLSRLPDNMRLAAKMARSGKSMPGISNLIEEWADQVAVLLAMTGISGDEADDEST